MFVSLIVAVLALLLCLFLVHELGPRMGLKGNLNWIVKVIIVVAFAIFVLVLFTGRSAALG